MTVLEIVQTKLSNSSAPAEVQQMSIDEAEQAIKNYCNIAAVPDALVYTWANIAVDLVRYQLASDVSSSSQGIDVGDISSLKIGDTNVSLGAVDGSGATSIARKSHKPDLDDIVMNYRAQLNKYRKMVW